MSTADKYQDKHKKLRIVKLQQAIKDKTYKIDSHKIAEKIFPILKKDIKREHQAKTRRK